MDNIAHSLVGLFAAAPFCFRQRPQAALAICSAALLASNLPDGDLSYCGVTEGPLGYMLHHRGHTHTFAFAPLGALLTAAVVWAASRVGGRTYTKAEWLRIWLLSFLGALLHVLFDGLNSYGIHPWWPIAKNWIYGDTLFIIEPSLWLLMLLFMLRWDGGPLRRAMVMLLLAAAFGLMGFSGYVPPFLIAVLALGAALLWLILRYLTIERSWQLVLCLTCAMIGAFAAASARAKNIAVESQLLRTPTAIIYEVVASPFPGNPLCWNTIAVFSQGATYELAQGIASLRLGACDYYEKSPYSTSFPVHVADERSGNVLWRASFRAELADLLELDRSDCFVSAYLRFARAPLYQRKADGVLLGDLRFQRGGSRLSQLLRKNDDRSCPRFVPQWGKPRADIGLLPD